MENYFSQLLHEFSNWGISTFFSILLSIIIIAISLPFTYIGYSIRKATEFRIKKYQGYLVKKLTIHAFVSSAILLLLETILYLVLGETFFYSITFILIILIIVGLLGFKLTFDIEEMIDGWIEGLFSKD